jgi:hypothetical protein
MELLINTYIGNIESVIQGVQVDNCISTWQAKGSTTILYQVMNSASRLPDDILTIYMCVPEI